MTEQKIIQGDCLDEIPNYPDPDPIAVEETINLEDAVHKNDPGEREATEDEIHNVDERMFV